MFIEEKVTLSLPSRPEQSVEVSSVIFWRNCVGVGGGMFETDFLFAVVEIRMLLKYTNQQLLNVILQCHDWFFIKILN